METSTHVSAPPKPSPSGNTKPRRFTFLLKALLRVSSSRLTDQAYEGSPQSRDHNKSTLSTVHQQPQQPLQSVQLAASNTSQDLTAAYILKRDYMGSCRLNLQYYLWKEALGFNIHPSIPIKSFPSNARIADVATGTGIWLMESQSLFDSTAKFDGLDIDLGCAPHPKWLPGNISLRQWNMLSEIPDDMVGVYDFVHVRLIMLVIKDNNPSKLINNLLKLLKPGGYLQWDEVDAESKKIVKVHDEVRADGINAMFRVDLPNGVKGSDDWQKELPTTLKTNGFSAAQRYDFEPNPATARYWHDMYTLAWDEVLTSTLGDRAEQALIAADQGMNEARNGAAISMPMVVWVAKKANPSLEE